jgi:Abnormal spindle-like microcephaly-assoc'd, ASPM-SPD-2-Hydin
MRRASLLLGLCVVALTAPTAQAGSAGPFSTDKDPSFGSVQIGNSPSTTVTLTNTDVLPHTINGLGGIVVDPSSGNDFSIQSDNCSGQTLNQNGTCTFDVQFAPNSLGAQSAKVDVNYDVTLTAVEVADLSGTGAGTPTADLSTNTLGFGPVAVGGSAQLQVSLTNNGNVALAVSGASIASGVAYSESDNCSGSLSAHGGSCTATVTFAPAQPGSDNGSLHFNDDLGTQAVSLTGAGLGPTADASTGTLNFGSQNVNSTSAPSSVTFTNNGTSALTGITASISAGSVNYTKTGDTCTGATVTAGTNCTVTVVFNPTAVGSLPGQVQLTDNAFDSPQTVALTGTGTSPNLQVDHTTLSYPSITVGKAGASQTVTLTNTGSGPLTIGTLSIPGPSTISPNPHSFTRTAGNCSGAVLAPNASCSVTVRFLPQARGTLKAQLSIPASPVGATVSLTGQATAPAPMQGVHAAVGCTASLITWKPNNSISGFRQTVIVRNRTRPPRTAIDGTRISPTSSGVLLNTRLAKHTTYYYALFAQYQFYAGGPKVYSDPTRETLRTERFCKPMNHAIISDTTPTVSWLAYPHALGYNLQVFRNGTKIYSPQTTAQHFTIGSKHALQRGASYVFKLFAYTPGHTNNGIPAGTETITVK